MHCLFLSGSYESKSLKILTQGVRGKQLYLRGGGHVERSCSWDVALIFVLVFPLFVAALLLSEEQRLKVLPVRVCT